jgi:hypothetical protein
MGEKVAGLISKRSLAHLARFEMSDGWKVELE